MRATKPIATAICVLVVLSAGLDVTRGADDFFPPSWVNTLGRTRDYPNGGWRDNRTDTFGVNPDWVPPANSTSYHWHWYNTIQDWAEQGYYEEYDSFASDTWYLPDHGKNLWNQADGEWSQAAYPHVPRNWGDYDLPALLANPRWEELGYYGDGIPDGAPRGTMNNANHGGLTWNGDGSGEPFMGVFEVPLYADMDSDPLLDTTLIRLQCGGGFGSENVYTYWDIQVEGIEGEEIIAALMKPQVPINSDTGTVFFQDWVLEGTPDRLRVTIEFKDTWVDQLLIDTIAVPEPTSLGLLAFGGLALLRRRRKQAT